jgi:hypothetical protein
VNAALWVGAAGLSVACYSYVPVSLDAVPAGTGVRAVLSTEAQLALRDSVGLRSQAVQGTLVDRSEDRLLLAIRADAGVWRAGSPALYQRVAVASRDVLRVEVKQFHRARTVGLVAALTTAAAVLTIEALRKGNPGTPSPPGGGPPE